MIEAVQFQTEYDKTIDINIPLIDRLLSDEKINRYMTSLKEMSPDTYVHSIAVAELVEKVAIKLKVRNLKEVVTGALLHDIGKIFVPDEILNKPDNLTEGEFDNIRLHPLNGLFYIMSDFSPEVNRIVRDHHEKLDGSGYFYGITDITFGTQIVTVCDMYDAMTHKRVYKEAFTPYESLMLLWKDADKNKINPMIVEVLSKIVRVQEKEKLTEK